MRCPRVPHPGNTAQFGTVPKTGGENRIGYNIHPPLMLLLLSFTSATFCTEKGNTRSLGARSSMPECRSKQSPKNALLRQRTPFRSSSKFCVTFTAKNISALAQQASWVLASTVPFVLLRSKPTSEDLRRGRVGGESWKRTTRVLRGYSMQLEIMIFPDWP